MLLAVIADDFTGALDAGIQFTLAGFQTQVFTAQDADLKSAAADCEVVVVDAESRHLDARSARERVRRYAADARGAGASYLFKKTDSVLRGNLGAELEGALAGFSGAQLCFAPAFPDNERFTIGGVQYLGATPVHRTAFGADPFNPLPDSDVRALLRLQTQLPLSLSEPADALPGRPGITVYNAADNAALDRIARAALRAPETPVFAGCAGFAAALAAALRPDGAANRPIPAFRLPQSLLLVSGSVNPITLQQHRYCYEAGYQVVSLSPAQKLSADGQAGADAAALRAFAARHAVSCRTLIELTRDAAARSATDEYAAALGLDAEATRTRITENAAGLTHGALTAIGPSVLAVFGGDTLIAIVRRLGIASLSPLCEIEPGVVLSRAEGSPAVRWIVSKSGGFGTPDTVRAIEAFCVAHA